MPKTTSIKSGNTSIQGSPLFIFLIFAFFSMPVAGQDKDAGMWSGLELDKGITKWLEARGAFEVRIDNNLSRAERYLAEIGLRSDIGKYLDASVTYRHTYRYFQEYNWASYHRIYADIRFNYDYMGFSFYERARATFDEIPPFLEEGYIETTIRLKTQATYNIRKTPLLARGSVEFFVPVAQQLTPYVEKTRYKMGMIYKINPSLSAELSHMFQQVTVRSKPQNNFIWVVTLSYSL